MNIKNYTAKNHYFDNLGFLISLSLSSSELNSFASISEMVLSRVGNGSKNEVISGSGKS